MLPAWMPGLLGRAAGRDRLHEGAVADGQVQALQRLVDRQRAHAEEGAVHAPGLLELRDDLLGGVDRDREADADVAAAAAAAGLDLRVDADHAAGSVDQRAAGVAGVDRRRRSGCTLSIGSRWAPGSGAAAARDDAGRERALEAERVADRDRRVADLHARGVAERQRLQVQARRGRPCSTARSVDSSVPRTFAVVALLVLELHA